MNQHESGRRPAGPRGAVGAQAEDAACAYLLGLGWAILGRNVRAGSDEIDILGLEPEDAPTVVVVEVRSRSGRGFGHPQESVDRRKLGKLYRAATALRRGGHAAIEVSDLHGRPWRVDLVALERTPGHAWSVVAHIRGLAL